MFGLKDASPSPSADRLFQIGEETKRLTRDQVILVEMLERADAVFGTPPDAFAAAVKITGLGMIYDALIGSRRSPLLSKCDILSMI